MLTPAQMRKRNRLCLARYVRQSRLLLREFGYICELPGKTITKKDWEAKFRRDLHYRLTKLQHGSKSMYLGVCAERAAAIVTQREESKWWFARDSNHRAGGDNRGILNVLKRWNRQGKVSIPWVAEYD